MKRTALLLSIALAGPALAHEAPSGWSYPLECCSNRDCAIATDARETRDGWVVTIHPGTHPMVPPSAAPHVVRIPRNAPEIKRSPDYDAHICLSPSLRLLCFFEPAGAS